MHKGPDGARRVFAPGTCARFPAAPASAHCRYPTVGLGVQRRRGTTFLCQLSIWDRPRHNGNLTNSEVLKQEMFRQDLRHINTNSDSEVLLNVLAHELELAAKGQKLDPETIFTAVANVHRRCRGAYAVVALIAGYGLLAFRDPFGIRPLVVRPQSHRRRTRVSGRVRKASRSPHSASSWCGTSCRARPSSSMKTERSTAANVRRNPSSPPASRIPSILPADSVMDAVSVYESGAHGRKLSEKIKRTMPHLEIDVVIPVPDTSRPAALELAHAST